MEGLLIKLLRLLDRHEKIQVVFMFFLLLVSAVLETVGISLIPAFIALLNQHEITKYPKILQDIYKFIGVVHIQDFLIWLGIGIIIFYILKNIYLSIVAHVQSKFIYNKQISLSTNLFRSYLFKSYSFHLQRNTAELLHNINNEVVIITSNILIPLILLVTELLVTCAILIFLIVIEPLTSLGAFILLGLVSLIFYRVIRYQINKLGGVRQYYGSKMVQWVNQGLGGIKEIKLLGKESFFVNAYAANSHHYNNAAQFMYTINQMPRFFLEAVMVASTLIVTLLSIIQHRDPRTILPTLTLFAVAAFRLLPSISRILGAITSIRYHKYAVDIVYRDMTLFEQKFRANGDIASYPIKFETSINLNNIHFKYQGGNKLSLQGVSISILKGQSIGLVGTSGAGKTTTVDVLLGLLTPDRGVVLVDGRDIRENLLSWQQQIGYIPQNIYLCDDSIRRNIAFGLRDEEIDDHQVWLALRASQLEERVIELTDQLDTLIGEKGIRLSGGQRQRIGIARALYHNPELLVMDEATASLDNTTEQEFMQALEAMSGKKTIIIIAHRLSTVKNCDRLYFLQAGQVVAMGTYDELMFSCPDFKTMAQT